MLRLNVAIMLFTALLVDWHPAKADMLTEVNSALSKAVSGEKSPVIVIGSGTRMNIADHHMVAIVGNDRCDLEKPITAPSEGCVILDKPEVIVNFIDAGKKVTEKWAIRNAGDKTYITRPNGYIVSQALK